jgi:muramoyltetrapeptide carboxypeptidase
LTRPARLVSGDKVALVAPSSGAPEDRVEAGVRVLQEWGLVVQVASNVTAKVTGHYGALEHLAGPDEVRAAEFERAWLDPDVRAVLCARGGDGANRMVELVNWEAVAAAGPKVLTGFSDITTLHVACARRLGLATLHAPMPLTSAFVEDEASREHMRRTLFEPESVMKLSSATAQPLLPGRARGVLVGGCLSLLTAELGTAHGLPDPDGAILVLEDTHENAARIDRCLGQLLRSGYLERVAGVVLGSWVDCGDPEQIRELFLNRLTPLGVPVLDELGFGHSTVNLTVPLGVEAELDADSATLTMLQPALS